MSVAKEGEGKMERSIEISVECWSSRLRRAAGILFRGQAWRDRRSLRPGQNKLAEFGPEGYCEIWVNLLVES